MAETVASQTYFCAPTFAAPGTSSETLRQQVEDFEDLIEAMLEKYEQTQTENRALKEENRALREENERLRSE